MNGYLRPIAPSKFDNFSGNTMRRQKVKNKTPDDFDRFAVEMVLDEDGDYLAQFAELPNVSAFGQTPDEALVELKTAWELMKECYREDGESIPTANAIQGAQTDEITSSVHLAQGAGQDESPVSARLSSPLKKARCISTRSRY